MVGMMYWLKSESKDCVVNPVKYFHEKNPQITCSCYQGNREVVGLGRDEFKINFSNLGE